MKTTLMKTMLVLAGIVLLSSVSGVFAVGGAYSLDFSAAQPRSYAKLFPVSTPPPVLVNGRAWNPVIGANFTDNVESLAPRDMSLGQIVIFELKIDVNGVVTPENGVIDVVCGWNSVLTSGGLFGFDPAYGVYSAFIDTGDLLHHDPLGNAKLTSSSSWVDSQNPKGVNDEIRGAFHIEGLESGDVVVLEIWLVLDSVLPPGATGNVQSRLVNAQTSLADNISTGNQTVPLMKVQDFASNVSVGDFVWLDSKTSGIYGVQDATEAGIAGALVELYAVSTVTSLVSSTTTAADGSYLFTGLTAGNYLLAFQPPDVTYEFTTNNVGGDDTLDSDADPQTGKTAVFTLSAGQVDLKWDVGMTVAPTLVAISSFGAAVVDGAAVIQWETSAELGAVGFFLERWDDALASYVRVNASLIPASMFSTGVETYEIVDTGAAVGGTYDYRLIEIENTGRINAYGPYTVTIGDAGSVVDGLDEQGLLALPEADADGDGQTNDEELRAGTDPLDAASVLRVTALQSGNGHMVLKWSSVESKTYTITRARTIGGEFEVVASGIPSLGAESMAVLIDGASAAMYRVAAE